MNGLLFRAKSLYLYQIFFSLLTERFRRGKFLLRPVFRRTAMEKDRDKDLTLEVLVSIRDEIRELRADTNKRFEQMDKRFEQMDKRFERIERDISQIKQGIDQIVTRFERDYLLLASEVDTMKKRLGTCEERLGITSN
jgi:methyl-accepting chemotaxis protein